jgi:hypothetical protein
MMKNLSQGQKDGRNYWFGMELVDPWQPICQVRDPPEHLSIKGQFETSGASLASQSGGTDTTCLSFISLDSVSSS